MNFRYNHLSRLITIPAQTILLVISTTVLIYLFYAPLEKFHSVGRESFVKRVTPEVIQKWGKEPVRVKTGFLIHEFLEFDVIKNAFLMNAVISFEFDPAQVKQEVIDKFAFTKGDIVKKSEPLVRKISPHRTFVEYSLRIRFSTLFDYSLFPLDDHRMFLNFTNTSVEARDLIFQVNEQDFSVPPYVFLAGWKIDSYKAVSGYTEFNSQKESSTQYPKIVFSLGIKKKDIRQLLLIMIPLLILFYFCLFSLSIKSFDTNVQEMFPLLTAFVAYVIVIQSMSPNVGYFMMMDYIVLFFLIAMFIICLVNFLSIIPKDRLSKETCEHIKGFTVLLVHISLITFIYYLTHVYMR
ncbi:MAG: hypothetical protein P4L31_04210 [Candidatus Babeliales bacterium]|nr:hypothetical protein [Candidatus Babeliales bacterium]